jgi:tRNA nucleotidyltransferase (CCA-adding enzyme)
MAHKQSLTGQIQSYLSAVPELATLQYCLSNEADLHLVGGTLRDLLLGKQPLDCDLATKFSPHQLEQVLGQNNIRVIETGIKHGTVTVLVGARHFEVTTFRKPGAAQTGAFANSIAEDLSGRDFTINAIAYSLNTNTLLDPFTGIEHLTAKKLVAVKDPVLRFSEDPLRVMRMVRFGPAEGRHVESQTLAAAKQHVTALTNISIERIRTELEKILISDHPRAAFQLMLEQGILELILPELLPTVKFHQNDFHTEDVFEHTLTVIEAAPKELPLRLAALFHDIGKPQTLSVDAQGARHFYKHEDLGREIAIQVMQRMRFSNELIDQVSQIVALHMRPLDCGPAGVRRLMRALGDNFDYWRTFKVEDSPPVMPQDEFTKLLSNFDQLVQVERERVKGSVYGKLAVGGDDLIALGVAPGKFLGGIIKELQEIVIENPELNEREYLLERARKMLTKDQDNRD